MTQKIAFDDSAGRALELAYATADVLAQRRAVRAALALGPGQRVLDVGSGPGLLAREMAEEVGGGGEVVGLDASEPMIALARRRCEGLAQVRFEHGDALRLPWPDGHFDAAVSTQVYEYVADLDAAFRELRRVMKPEGRVAILDTDYDSLVIHTEDPERMRRVLEVWDEHFVHRDLPQRLAPTLCRAGFRIRGATAIPLFDIDYQPDRFSYHLTTLMASFVAGRSGVSEEDARAWHAELRDLGERGEYFYSLNRYLFVAEAVAPKA